MKPHHANIAVVRRLYEARGTPDIVKTVLAQDVRMFLALWVRLCGVVGNPHFNIHVVRGK